MINIYPFDLETAKLHPEWVYYRNGTKVLEILHSKICSQDSLCIFSFADDSGEFEMHLLNGRYMVFIDRDHNLDLVLIKDKNIITHE